MFRRIATAALLIAAAGPAAAVELNPKAIAIRQADELKWRDPTGAAPTNNVVLFGDPTKPGFYMVMNRFKPGASDAFRQGGALRRRQGRRGGRADHRRRPRHQHAGRRGEVVLSAAADLPPMF